LIEERGFNGVAVEADFPDAFRANLYIRGLSEDKTPEDGLEDFIRFPTWMWYAFSARLRYKPLSKCLSVCALKLPFSTWTSMSFQLLILMSTKKMQAQHGSAGLLRVAASAQRQGGKWGQQTSR
jgi:hypothetical protein